MPEESRPSDQPSKRPRKKIVLKREPVETTNDRSKSSVDSSTRSIHPLRRESSRAPESNESMETIPPQAYQLRKNQLYRRSVRYLVILGLLSFGFSAYLVWFYHEQRTWKSLIETATGALDHLKEHRSQTALPKMEHALALYRDFHIRHPDFWWQHDSALFSVMLDVALGFGSIGHMDLAIETIYQINRHNSRGPESWVGKAIDERMARLLESDQWNEERRFEAYQHLLTVDPNSWGKGYIHLIRFIERLGLLCVPMSERVEQAGLIVYGTPKPMMRISDTHLDVDGIRYYKVDRLPGPIDILISNSMPDHERTILKWYSETGQPCLIFTRIDELSVYLDRIESILTTQPDTVLEFNRIYDAL